MKRCECGNIIGKTQAVEPTTKYGVGGPDERTIRWAVETLRLAADAPDDTDIRQIRSVLRLVAAQLAKDGTYL